MGHWKWVLIPLKGFQKTEMTETLLNSFLKASITRTFSPDASPKKWSHHPESWPLGSPVVLDFTWIIAFKPFCLNLFILGAALGFEFIASHLQSRHSYHLSHSTSSFFCNGFFPDRVSWTIYPGLVWNLSPPDLPPE
jgi:hypothetical protein